VHGVSVRPVLGLDIGGTWTRVLAVDAADGERLGSGHRAGANPITHGVTAASRHISAAVDDALRDAGLSGWDIERCVAGMAGASKLAGDPEAARAIERLWTGSGLTCEVEVVSDVTTAFAAGSADPDGSVLLAGTGAIAATMARRRPVALHGGHGWLLGDEGSGYWIGRQAVRATLVALDEGRPLGPLHDVVLAHYAAAAHGTAEHSTAEHAAQEAQDAPAPQEAQDVPAAQDVRDVAPAADFGLDEGRRVAAALIAAVNARPPIDLAALAPLVTGAADDGDAAASLILREAADHLVDTLARARSGHDPATPIVLAGGILTPRSLVYRLVLAAVADRWPKAVVAPGIDGAAGAAWLAARHLLGGGPAAEALHARLCGAACA
jgi:glucosamine kinase